MTIEQDINAGFFHAAMNRAETAEARVRTLEATIFSISEANDMLLDRAERAEARIAALEAALDTETQGRYSALMLCLADYFADQQHAKIIVE
jgi:chromosome segregation ATPase